MKTLTLGILLTLSAALPAAAQSSTESPPVGRYTITFSAEGLYFLDTATGALWMKPYEGGWVTGKEWEPVDSPVNPRPEAAKVNVTDKKPVSLTVPEEGVTMPMIQRERRKIPGSSKSLSVQLGDITGGQVFVEVIDVNGDYLVKRTSLKNKEFLSFKVGDKTYYLQIVDMFNNLFDDDICKVRITTTKPQVEVQEEAAEAEDATVE